MTQHTIRVEGVSKKFSLGLNDAIRYGLLDLGKKFTGGSQSQPSLRSGEFWALQDVSFDLSPGEAIGILGVNGSGKTTLLRILNGAFLPDKGFIEIHGRVGALIAAGAGFSPLLTGRENVFVNGSLLGMTKLEIERQFDEIVHLSGLGKFIDMPVRNYSSGMIVRLGFSIAIMGNPNLLLIDEVLAVGDVAFQKICYEKILYKINQGASVIFISHSVGAIWAICDKGLFLDRGISCGVESVEDACRRYELANHRALATQNASSDTTILACATKNEARILGLRVCNATDGNDQDEFEFQEPLMMIMKFELGSDVDDVILRYSFDATHYKFICALDSSYSGSDGIIPLRQGTYEAKVILSEPAFRPGAYFVNCAVCSKSIGVHLDARQSAASFVIKPPQHIFLYDTDSPAVIYAEADHSVHTLDIIK